MAKTILYRLFGLGKIPPRTLAILEAEGIDLVEEGIHGSLTFRRFRAPGRYYGLKCSLISGSLVLTRKRFLAFTSFWFCKTIIDIPLDDERIQELHCTVKKGTKLFIRFDAAKFHKDWSGTVTCRYSTPLANSFLERLRVHTT